MRYNVSSRQKHRRGKVPLSILRRRVRKLRRIRSAFSSFFPKKGKKNIILHNDTDYHYIEKSKACQTLFSSFLKKDKFRQKIFLYDATGRKVFADHPAKRALRKVLFYENGQIFKGIAHPQTPHGGGRGLQGSKVSVNGKDVKPAYSLKIGDVVELKFAAGSLKFRVLDLKETVKKEEAASLYEILSNSARHALVPLCRCVSERPFPAPCADSTRVRIFPRGPFPCFPRFCADSPRVRVSPAQAAPLFSSAPCAAFLKGDIVKIYVILPAAGSGSRAGFEKNKILQKIGGRVPFFAPFPPLPPCPRSQRSPCASANGTGKRFARFSPRFRRPCSSRADRRARNR